MDDGGVLNIARSISQVGVARWPMTGSRWGGGVLNITTVAWTVGFQWWHSGDITRTQNVSEYMLVLALCLVDKREPSGIIGRFHMIGM